MCINDVGETWVQKPAAKQLVTNHSKLNTKMKLFILSILLFGGAFGHDEYRGKCPGFKPMPGFDWDKVTNIFYLLRSAAKKTYLGKFFLLILDSSFDSLSLSLSLSQSISI